MAAAFGPLDPRGPVFTGTFPGGIDPTSGPAEPPASRAAYSEAAVENGSSMKRAILGFCGPEYALFGSNTARPSAASKAARCHGPSTTCQSLFEA